MSQLPALRPARHPVLPAGGPALRRIPAVLPRVELTRHAGPDAAIGEPPVRVRAIFSTDSETGRLRVAIIDERGRLLRLVPEESVARMLTAMAAYPR